MSRMKRDLEVAEGVHEVARNRRLASEKAAWDLLTYGKIPDPKDQKPRAWDPANLQAKP